jgi:DNA-binding HxlR family transcriptional regulator
MRCDSECPIQAFSALFAGKWSLAVLAELLRADGPIRFVELGRHVGGLTRKELAKTLRDLEAAGLVTRHCFAEVPPRVEYAVTDLARSLRPVFAEIEAWCASHRPELRQVSSARSED